MLPADLSHYVPSRCGSWQGRIDHGTRRDLLRWHQVVEPLDLLAIEAGAGPRRGFCVLGYACDAGVTANRGRPGAARGPEAIRRRMSDLPVSFSSDVALYDAGDIRCDDAVEQAQRALAAAVARIVALGLFPIVLGGGHDLVFGHWLGLTAGLDRATTLGVVSMDAHLDLRLPTRGANSGTSFAQIAEHCRRSFTELHYLCVGAQPSANTVGLFRRADELGVRYVLARDILERGPALTEEQLASFLGGVDAAYLTIDADVLSSAHAPGVSAPQPLGLTPSILTRLVRRVVDHGTTVGCDVAEVSPPFDRDGATATVAASLVHAVVDGLLAPGQRLG